MTIIFNVLLSCKAQNCSEVDVLKWISFNDAECYCFSKIQKQKTTLKMPKS